ncbi:hypothetical protein [Spirosoma flavus]
MKKLLPSFLTCFLLLMILIQAKAQTTTSVSGRVLDYLYNRIGDYDGLRLKTTTGEVHLLFPPHTAARIRRVAAVGQSIIAEVEPGHGGPGHPRPGVRPSETDAVDIPAYRLIRLQNGRLKTGLQLADIPPPLPQSGPLVQAEGPLVEEMRDDHGRLSALLTDKYLIELKPHQSEQISSLLVGVQRLGVAGFERIAEGFVNRTGRPLLHPTSLTIRGQTFAL